MTTIALEQRTAVGPHRRELQVILASAPVGAAVVIACTIPPATSGPPLHAHATADETFFVLSGVLLVDHDGQVAAIGEDGLVHVSHGTPHTFATTPDTPACFLMLHTNTTRPDDRRLRGLAPGPRRPQSLTIPPRTRISTQRTIESSAPGTSTNTPVRASAARHDITFARAQHRRPPDRHVLPSRTAAR